MYIQLGGTKRKALTHSSVRAEMRDHFVRLIACRFSKSVVNISVTIVSAPDMMSRRAKETSSDRYSYVASRVPAEL
jgi:ribulose bisphosphate carboxylase small subunit